MCAARNGGEYVAGVELSFVHDTCDFLDGSADECRCCDGRSGDGAFVMPTSWGTGRDAAAGCNVDSPNAARIVEDGSSPAGCAERCDCLAPFTTRGPLWAAFPEDREQLPSCTPAPTLAPVDEIVRAPRGTRFLVPQGGADRPRPGRERAWIFRGGAAPPRAAT